MGNERFDSGAFGEHLHIELTAACLRPRKFEGRQTRFVFIGSREVIAETQQRRGAERRPASVGHLTFRGQQSEYLGTLPYDAATTLPLVMLAGGYRFIYLSGAAVYRGSASITSSSFYRDFDPNDFEL